MARLLVLLAASAVGAAVINVDSLRLQWLDGFLTTPGEMPLQLTGHDGALGLVSVFRIEAAAGEPVAERV